MSVRLLLVKTSSLGDVVHALPALTEAAAAVPGLRCDWVVEEAFAAIPAWHPAVERVIPVALRRWRRRPRAGEIGRFLGELRRERYDLVLDAQGLVKSALLARLARGPRAGPDRASAREGLAARAYQRPVAVPYGPHAVERARLLFAAALGYPSAAPAPGYGLDTSRLQAVPGPDTLVLLHASTWTSKLWPLAYWQQLAARAAQAGLTAVLPWGNAAEHARAKAIAAAAPGARVLPRLGLSGVAAILAGARAVVGVDSGLAHLAAALGRPTVTIYGATDPARTGTWGPGQVHLRADFPCAPCLRRVCNRPAAALWPPCYAALTPDAVWTALGGALA